MFKADIDEDCLISSVNNVWSVDPVLFAVVKMVKVDFDEDCLISSVNNIFSVDCSFFAVVKMFKVDFDVVGPLVSVLSNTYSNYNKPHRVHKLGQIGLEIKGYLSVFKSW